MRPGRQRRKRGGGGGDQSRRQEAAARTTCEIALLAHECIVSLLQRTPRRSRAVPGRNSQSESLVSIRNQQRRCARAIAMRATHAVRQLLFHFTGCRQSIIFLASCARGQFAMGLFLCAPDAHVATRSEIAWLALPPGRRHLGARHPERRSHAGRFRSPVPFQLDRTDRLQGVPGTEREVSLLAVRFAPTILLGA